jgi:hypothetical protein
MWRGLNIFLFKIGREGFNPLSLGTSLTELALKQKAITISMRRDDTIIFNTYKK